MSRDTAHKQEASLARCHYWQSDRSCVTQPKIIIGNVFQIAGWSDHVIHGRPTTWQAFHLPNHKKANPIRFLPFLLSFSVSFSSTIFPSLYITQLRKNGQPGRHLESTTTPTHCQLTWRHSILICWWDPCSTYSFTVLCCATSTSVRFVTGCRLIQTLVVNLVLTRLDSGFL